MKHIVPCLAFFVLSAICFSIIIPSTNAQGPDDDNREAASNQTLEDARGGFTPLVGIPYVDTTDSNLSLPGYVDALYKAAISIAAFLAVVKIIFAGVKYMLSDVVTSKEDAKKDIRGALIGLLIVIGAVLILNTINPQLKELTALGGPPGLNMGLGEHDGFLTSIQRLCESPTGCVVRNCTFWRLSSCEDVCDDLNGFYVRNGILRNLVGVSDQTSDQCVIATPSEAEHGVEILDRPNIATDSVPVASVEITPENLPETFIDINGNERDVASPARYIYFLEQRYNADECEGNGIASQIITGGGPFGTYQFYCLGN